MTDKLEFNLDLKEIPVEFVADGEKTMAFLRELTGAQRDKYLNGVVQRLRVDKDGNTKGIRDFRSLQSSLLSLCLWKVCEGEMVLFSDKEIQAMPSRVSSTLFDRARELSGLEKEEGEDEDPKE